jgi:hypothetical protein
MLLPELPTAEISARLGKLMANPRIRQATVTRNVSAVRETFDRERNLRRFVEAYQGLTAKISAHESCD